MAEKIYLTSREELESAVATINDKINKKSDAVHEHDASDIVSGIIPISNGGTGAATTAEALTNLGIIDWFRGGTSIPSNSDLDTYTTVGVYYASNEAIAQTLVNCPATGNFKMYVFTRTSGNSINQLIFGRNSIFIRGANSSGAWSAWKSYATNDHTHSDQTLNPINIEMFPDSSAGHGGFIDFHYNGSTADYTSRIIENASGSLNFDADLATLTGQTFRVFNGYGGLMVGTNVIQLEHYAVPHDINNRTMISVYASSDIEKAVRLIRNVDGVASVYQIYGQHNITAGTSDLTAGSSSLTTGNIYQVYS